MKLSEIYKPIEDVLDRVDMELDSIAESQGDTPAGTVLRDYFRIRGKLLRPALLVFSAGAADSAVFLSNKQKIVKAAAAIELIHNASLIHDDIIDGDLFRRGKETLNKTYGSKVGVLVGDALFARAVSLSLEVLPRETAFKLIRMVKRMSTIEARQLKENRKNGREQYLRLIEQKTGLLMSAACMLGASMVTESLPVIAAFETFGLNFGMTYQLVDDAIDKDPEFICNAKPEDTEAYAQNCRAFLKGLDNSIYSEGLTNMLQYILSKTHIELEEKVKR